jgi:phytoene dehydrogenase-like protein
MTSTDSTWDAIVIGSGIGGLSCAAALAKTGHRVLMLEQHSVAGGLTQTFSRNGFTWNVGVHYRGEMEPGGAARAVLDWLADRPIQFTSMGAVYDTVHFPGDFEIQLSRPEPALKLDLKEKCPGSEAEIDAFLDALAYARRAGRAVFAQRALPALLAKVHALRHRDEIRKWWSRTCAEVLEELVTDARLRSVLLAQRGDYGGLPRESSFGIHATIMRHYFNGAFYPVGGAGVFAAKLIPVIERAGGQVMLNAQVRELMTEQGAVVGSATEPRSVAAGYFPTPGRTTPSAGCCRPNCDNPIGRKRSSRSNRRCAISGFISASRAISGPAARRRRITGSTKPGMPMPCVGKIPSQTRGHPGCSCRSRRSRIRSTFPEKDCGIRPRSWS